MNSMARPGNKNQGGGKKLGRLERLFVLGGKGVLMLNGGSWEKCVIRGRKTSGSGGRDAGRRGWETVAYGGQWETLVEIFLVCSL